MNDQHDASGADDDRYGGPKPPQDVMAEQALLSALLNSPEAVTAIAAATSPEHFYRPAHGAIYAAILAVADAGDVPDPTMVAQHLAATGELVRCGGEPYLLDLYANVVPAKNAETYAETVRGKAAQRKVIDAGRLIQQLAHRDVTVDEIPTLLEDARGRIDSATQSFRQREDSGAWVGDLMQESLERYAQPVPPGLPTGWPDLDELLLGGLKPGTLTIIGARPAVGKSMVGLQLAINAVRSGTGVLFASLEMSRQEIMDRVFSQVGRVELSRLTQHKLDDYDWVRVRKVAEDLKSAPLWVEDSPAMPITRLRGLARDLTRGPAGCGLVVADYLQLIESTNKQVKRYEQVSEFSRQLKLLAKELRAPVVALSQLNRDVEKRTTQQPVLADLRESGSIEQDADNVLLLWHNTDEKDKRRVNVAKARQGATGEVELLWSPRYASAHSLYAV